MSQPYLLCVIGTSRLLYVLILNSNPLTNFPIWHWSKMSRLVKVKASHLRPGMFCFSTIVLFDFWLYHVLFSFVKTWKVANNGDDRWPDGSYLAFTGGVNLALQTAVPVAPLNPGEVTDISVDMNSPSLPGMYESKWRMATPNGSYFGGNCNVNCIFVQDSVLNFFIFIQTQYGWSWVLQKEEHWL